MGNNYIFESQNCKNQFNYFKIISLQNPSVWGTIVLFLMLILFIAQENTKPDVSINLLKAIRDGTLFYLSVVLIKNEVQLV